jgi:tRNA (guanine-N7-)-methyltransferase
MCKEIDAMRRRRKPGSKEKLLSHKAYVTQTPQDFKGKWKSDWFENDKPIHLELGAGRAAFSIKLAQKYPDINFIAVELKEEVILPGVEMAKELGLENIAFVWVNILNIHEIFESNEIDHIYLNFSDPWPKKRHYKRRLTYRGFLEKYAEILVDKGWVEFKTDSDVLFEFTLNECAQLNLPMKEIGLDLHNRNNLDVIITTDYEEKYIAQGKRIYRMLFGLDPLKK